MDKELAQQARELLLAHRCTFREIYTESIREWIAAHPYTDRPRVPPETPRTKKKIDPSTLTNPGAAIDAALVAEGVLLTAAYGTSLQRVCLDGLKRWMVAHPIPQQKAKINVRQGDIENSNLGDNILGYPAEVGTDWPDKPNESAEAEQWETRLVGLLHDILRSGNQIAIRAIAWNLKAFRALSLGLSNEDAIELSEARTAAETAARQAERAKALAGISGSPGTEGTRSAGAKVTGGSLTNRSASGRKIS